MKHVSFVVLAGLVACSGPSASIDLDEADRAFKTRGIDRLRIADVQPVPNKWLAVTLLTQANQRWYGVPPGSVLRSGESMALRVGLSRGAFVYVINQTDNGALRLLYPENEQENRFMPGGSEIRIPPSNMDGSKDVFVLDEKPGLEKMFVVASRARIPAVLAAIKDKISASSLRVYTRPSDQRPLAAPESGPDEPVVEEASQEVDAGVVFDMQQSEESDVLTRGGRGVVRRKQSPTLDADDREGRGYTLVLVTIDHRP